MLGVIPLKFKSNPAHLPPQGIIPNVRVCAQGVKGDGKFNRLYVDGKRVRVFTHDGLIVYCARFFVS